MRLRGNLDNNSVMRNPVYNRPRQSFQKDPQFLTWLTSQWIKTCGVLGPKSRWNQQKAVEEFHVLESFYRQPHRYYHNLEHLAHCFSELEWLSLAEPHTQRYIKNIAVVRWAIWFHDAVYEPTRHLSNELNSACMATEILRSKGHSNTFLLQVFDAIVATNPECVPVDGDESIVVDIDRSILGRPKPEFNAYCDGIAKEFAWVPRELYLTNRIEFLRGMLNMSRIYRTVPFCIKYEDPAKQNLDIEIRKLEALQLSEQKVIS